jgi:hypothetical protein
MQHNYSVPSELDEPQLEGHRADSIPRRREDIVKARFADLEIHEGDHRGEVFFGEFEARKKLTKAMDHAWSDLLSKGCDSFECIASYETADRCKHNNAELKEFEGFLSFHVREMERIRLGHADHSYVNFLSPSVGKKKHVTTIAEVTTTSGGDSAAVHTTISPARKRRASVALTTFHRDLMDFQDLVEVQNEEQEARLGLVLDCCGALMSFGASFRH